MIMAMIITTMEVAFVTVAMTTVKAMAMALQATRTPTCLCQ